MALAVGANAITVRVTAENGTTQDYTVTVTRAEGLPTVTVAAAIFPGETVAEGADAAFTLSRTGSTTAALTVTVTVSQTGAVLKDASAVPSSVTFAADAATAPLALETDDDDTDDDAGTVTVTLGTGTGYTVGEPGAATVAVSDNDVPVDFVLAVPATVAEDAGPATVTVTATTAENAPPATALAVQLARVDGTSTGGIDYEAVSETVRFQVSDFAPATVDGQPRYQAVWTHDVVIHDDEEVEDDETVVLEMSPTSAFVLIHTLHGAHDAVRATLTIVDDDLPVVTIAADKTVVWDFEGAAGFTLSRTGSTAATLTVTVEVTQQVNRDLLPDGAAAERTVTFAVGGATTALSVALENDDLAELQGELTVEVQAGSGYTVGDPALATVTVRDGDEGQPMPANLMAEAGAGAGEVALSWDAYAPHLKFFGHQYRYKTDGNYAAWTDIPNSGQHETGAGDGSNLTGYTVTGLVGGQVHTFQVRTHYLKPDGITLVVSGSPDEAMATPRSALVSFGAVSYSVDEGGTVEVTVELDAALGREVVVPVSAAGAGGATPPGETGADWSGVPENVTFGATDTEQTFTLAATDDTDADAGESVSLSFGTLPAGVTSGTPSEATVTIVDAVVPVVTIVAVSGLVIEESRAAGFTLSRTGSTAAALTVTVAVTQQEDRDLLPDGAAAARTVTFAVDGATTALSVALEDDDLDEATGVLTVEVRAGSGYTVGDPGSATVDVIDTDTGRPQPANLTASAGAGVGEVELSWDAHAPELVFDRHQYQYKTDGNYAAWTDIPNSGQHIDDAGDGSNLTGYRVTSLAGGQVHTFQVRTYNSSSSASDPSDEATATPRSAVVSFGAVSYSVDEGGTVEVTVELDAAPGREVVVPVSAAGAGGATPPGETGADWSGVPESVTFGATDTEQTFTLTATDDTDAETGESVALSFGTLPAGVTAGTPSEATVTIAADQSFVSELLGAAGAGFTLSRTGSTAAELPVTVAVTQEEDRDLLPDGAAAERTVTFAVGSATAALTVALENDDLAEESGVLTVEVQAGSGYTVGDTGSATVSVVDGDSGRPKPANLTAAAAGVGEVVLSWDAHAPQLVFTRHQYRYKTDGNYAAWTDIPNSGQHDTGAGDGSNLTGYTVTGLVGGQVHTFQVRTHHSSSSASDPSNEATATPRSAAVTFGAGSYSVDEGGTVEVTVELDAAPGREVVVPVSAAGAGGATPPGETGADWSGVPESVTFGATDTEQTFTLTATDDTDADPDGGGHGGSVGQRRGRRGDRLRAQRRRRPGAVLYRLDVGRADVPGGAQLRGPAGREHRQRLCGGGAGDQRHGRPGADGDPDHHGDGDGRGRAAGQTGQADAGGGLGLVHEPGRELDRAGAERRSGAHRLQRGVPRGHDGHVGGLDAHGRGDHDDHHRADGEHGVSSARAGAQRRDAERLVGRLRCGQHQCGADDPAGVGGDAAAQR